MIVPFVDLQAQYRTIKTEVDEAIQRVLDTSAFILGREVEEFERAFAEYVGARECADALVLVSRAVRLRRVFDDDEIMTCRDFKDGVEVCRLAVEVNRNYRARAFGDS